MVDLDNIFSLFGNYDHLDGGDNSNTLIDIKSSPLYKVGMFKKVILNHVNFNKKIIKLLIKSNEDLDINDLKEAGENIVYNRAWNYIKNIDINLPTHQEAIIHYSDEYLDTALKMCISYYVDYEEYEKCAHLQKFLDFLSK
jgi:hypothetical protein